MRNIIFIRWSESTIEHSKISVSMFNQDVHHHIIYVIHWLCDQFRSVLWITSKDK